MRSGDSTLDVDYFQRAQAAAPVPGLLLLLTAGEPKCGPVPFDGVPLLLGRGSPPSLHLEDQAMSREHARVRFADGHFHVADLGSRNGLVLDGTPVGPGEQAPPGGRVLRVGRTVFLLVEDLRLYIGQPLTVNEREVIGPVLGQAWAEIDVASQSSDVLHLNAESGAGKELAARRFAGQGPRAGGPFVPVNCAAIPQGVAERLLFGTKKGAFSGASENAEGYFQAASGGTLFLDEVAELDLEVQAKLLRVLETGDVLPLGASKPEHVNVRVVSATHQDMRAAVAEKRFREDLFFRLCRPAVTLPPLRDRPEEIAFHAAAAAARVDRSLSLGPAFLERCLLLDWPGNVRELIQETEDAARRSARAGALCLEPEHLDDEAGLRTVAHAGAGGADKRAGPRQLPDDDVIAAALARADGRVATAARELGVHRNQLRRWLQRTSGPDES